jgi:uncharacterized membrane protein YfcA
MQGLSPILIFPLAFRILPAMSQICLGRKNDVSGRSQWECAHTAREAISYPSLLTFWLAVLCLGGFACAAEGAAGVSADAGPLAWWIWPLILFVVCFLLGIVAVLAGIGGGVLFVPIVGGFFPFHLDFVRGAGLLVALSAALSAGPRLLKQGLADLRLSMPVGLMASAGAIGGAMAGLAMPQQVVNICLGVAILGIVVVMALAGKSEYPDVPKSDTLSVALRISGIYHETSTGQDIPWRIHRTPQALALFVGIGFLAGMFGLGAGWANTPVLNLLMGVPLKMAVSTSVFVLSIADTSAAWIYINKGAVLPILVAPSVIGVMLGSRLGVKILTRARPASVRYIAIGLLLFSGTRALLKGLGVWN